MSIKTVAVLNDSDLQDGQMKEVDFDGGKVLLSRLGDQIHATSAFCTHVGAPLSKGVLTADGRIVCPWHGACFNLATGDIEDAPAVNAIHCFKAEIVDGKIEVTANPDYTKKENLARPPKLSTAGFDQVGKGTVVIGGGSGAFQTVEAMRNAGYRYPITIVTRETHTPIDRTKLSKTLITDVSKLELKTAAELKIKYGINIRTGVSATGLELEKRRVILDGGKDGVMFDTLVIATGGIPRRLPIPGADLENVYTLRGLPDAKKIDEAALEGKNLVVIGSSFISMELVAVVSKRKLASIHVIGMEEYPFEAVLGKEIGKGLQKYHESQGVIFHMQTKIEKIVPQEGNPNLAGGVIVNGETIPADFVVMGVGVSPATEWLKGSKFPLQKDGSIKVDEYMHVEDLPASYRGIYAIGDVAQYKDIHSNTYRRIEHWNVAGNQGRCAGHALAGQEVPFQKIPVFWSAQGQQLRYCGYGVGYQDIIIRGNPEEMKFIAFYLKEDESTKEMKVVAVASMQNDPVVSKSSELLRLGLMPTPQELRDGKDVLSVDISSRSSLKKIT